jgi:hypothetical protein
MQRLLVVVLLVAGCSVNHNHKQTAKVPTSVSPSCELVDKFATPNVVVIISKNCFKNGSTMVAVAFQASEFDRAAEEAANIIPRLLKYKPILAPVFKTYIVSKDKKHNMPFIIFSVVGRVR